MFAIPLASTTAWHDCISWIDKDFVSSSRLILLDWRVGPNLGCPLGGLVLDLGPGVRLRWEVPGRCPLPTVDSEGGSPNSIECI